MLSGAAGALVEQVRTILGLGLGTRNILREQGTCQGRIGEDFDNHLDTVSTWEHVPLEETTGHLKSSQRASNQNAPQ